MMPLMIYRMIECNLTYGSDTLYTLPHTQPVYRVFTLHSLSSNTTYRVFLSCQDIQGVLYRSNIVTFHTGLHLPPTSPLLAAVQGLARDKTNRGLLSGKRGNSRSPHVTMGKIHCHKQNLNSAEVGVTQLLFFT